MLQQKQLTRKYILKCIYIKQSMLNMKGNILSIRKYSIKTTRQYNDFNEKYETS